MYTRPLLPEGPYGFKLDTNDDDKDSIVIPRFNRNVIVLYLLLCTAFHTSFYYLYGLTLVYVFDISNETDWMYYAMFTGLTLFWFWYITNQIILDIRELRLVLRKPLSMPLDKIEYYNDFYNITLRNARNVTTNIFFAVAIFFSFTIFVLSAARFPHLCRTQDLCHEYYRRSFLVFSAVITTWAIKCNDTD